MVGPLKRIFDKKIDKIQAKLVADKLSYKLSIENLRQEAALIFTHFNVTQNLRKSINITDKAGRKFKIDLDSVPFMVQRKGDLIFPQIDKFMQLGQKEKAENLIESVVATLVSRSRKGIYDGDAKIYKNIGCIDDKAMFIDIGRMRDHPHMKETVKIKEDLLETTDKLKLFLQNKHPELAPFLQSQIETATL